MFGKDLSRILDLGDPEEMARRLDELDRKMEQAQASYEQLEPPRACASPRPTQRA